MIFLIIGILSGFLTLFLNYCMGKPASQEFSPYEIGSWYTILLSRRRLRQIGILDQYEEQYKSNLEMVETKWGNIGVDYFNQTFQTNEN